VPKRIVAVFSIALMALMLTLTHPARSDDGIGQAWLTIKVDEPQCVGGIRLEVDYEDAKPTRLDGYTWKAGPFREYAQVRLAVDVVPGTRCYAGWLKVMAYENYTIEGASSASTWLRAGDNLVEVHITYKRPMKVYASVAVNGEACLDGIKASTWREGKEVSIDVQRVAEGIYKAGPWVDGEPLRLEAIPKIGCMVEGWLTDAPTALPNPLWVTAEKNMTLKAILRPLNALLPEQEAYRTYGMGFSMVRVEASPPDAGKVRVSTVPITQRGLGLKGKMELWVEPGTTVYVEAYPLGCYEFLGWTGEEHAVRSLGSSELGSFVAKDGYAFITAEFRQMDPCPYVVLGDARIMTYEQLWMLLGWGLLGTSLVGSTLTVPYFKRRLEEVRRRRASQVERKLEGLREAAGEPVNGIFAFYPGEGMAPGMEVDGLRQLLTDGCRLTLSELALRTRGAKGRLLNAILRECREMYRTYLNPEHLRCIAGSIGAYLAWLYLVPSSRKVFERWIERVHGAKTEEDAVRYVRLLREDDVLRRLQERDVSKLSAALMESGLMDRFLEPPAPLREALEEVYVRVYGERPPFKDVEKPSTQQTRPLEEAGAIPEDGTRRCPYCEAVLKPSYRFCLSCGAELKGVRREGVGQEERPEKYECPYCGSYVRESDRYCMACGARLTKQKEMEAPEGKPAEAFRPEEAGPAAGILGELPEELFRELDELGISREDFIRVAKSIAESGKAGDRVECYRAAHNLLRNARLDEDTIVAAMLTVVDKLESATKLLSNVGENGKPSLEHGGIREEYKKLSAEVAKDEEPPRPITGKIEAVPGDLIIFEGIGWLVPPGLIVKPIKLTERMEVVSLEGERLESLVKHVKASQEEGRTVVVPLSRPTYPSQITDKRSDAKLGRAYVSKLCKLLNTGALDLSKAVVLIVEKAYMAYLSDLRVLGKMRRVRRFLVDAARGAEALKQTGGIAPKAAMALGLLQQLEAGLAAELKRCMEVDRKGAGRMAVKALLSGFMDPEELEALAEAVQAVLDRGGTLDDAWLKEMELEGYGGMLKDLGLVR